MFSRGRAARRPSVDVCRGAPESSCRSPGGLGRSRENEDNGATGKGRRCLRSCVWNAGHPRSRCLSQIVRKRSPFAAPRSVAYFTPLRLKYDGVS